MCYTVNLNPIDWIKIFVISRLPANILMSNLANTVK